MSSGSVGINRGGAVPAAAGRVPVKVVAATVAGNALEFYDFITYAFFAVYIGRAFFPTSDPLSSLLSSLAVFGVGFFFRPLGGFLIGAYADRAGRKPAMLLTIALITIGTLGLALTPTYASIGIAAPVILILCRLIQGLALGGEVGPASAFLIEIAPEGKRGLYSSWQLASQGMAALAAGIIGVTLSRTLSPEDLASWGWRVPFLLALALIPVAVYLRREMPETLHDAGAAPTSARASLGGHWGLIGLSILVVMGGTVSTYVGNYMTTFAITTLKLSPSVALTAAIVGGVAIIVCSLAGGWLCDKYNRRTVMIAPRIALALVAFPLFLLLKSTPTPGMLYLVTAVMAGLTAVSGAASLAAIPELLPRPIRALGLSIAYAVGVSIFGGTTQFIVTWLIGATGDPTAPAWYVTATSVICLVAMWALPESKGRALEG